ncbi:hypothetical protein [Pseudomonas sp. S2_E01]
MLAEIFEKNGPVFLASLTGKMDQNKVSCVALNGPDAGWYWPESEATPIDSEYWPCKKFL